RDEKTASGTAQVSASETVPITNSDSQNDMDELEEIESVSDFDPAQLAEAADSTDFSSPSPSPLPSLLMETAKSRVEETLGRIKLTVEQIDPINSTSPGARLDEHIVAQDLRAQDSAYEELAKRKAQIVTAVRAAEMKAREAETAFKQLEVRLEAEIAK